MRNAVTVISTVLLFCVSLCAQTIPISEARADTNHDFIPDRLNDTVTVTGVVFTPNYQTIKSSYFISDGTAGINLFLAKLLSTPLQLGDSVVVTGQIKQSFGLTQIVPFSESDIQLVSSNAITPEPIELKAGEFIKFCDLYEGSLVRVLRLKKIAGSIWPLSGNATLSLTDGFDTIEVRIDSDTNIDGKLEPLWPKDIVGVVFHDNSIVDWVNKYQILPRYYETDFLPATPVAVSDKNVSLSGYELHQNYPNPFNPTTIIKYSVPVVSEIKISISNLLGQKIKEYKLINESPGEHSIIFDASGLSPGIYFYTLQSHSITNGFFTTTKKMMLLK